MQTSDGVFSHHHFRPSGEVFEPHEATAVNQMSSFKPVSWLFRQIIVMVLELDEPWSEH